MGKYGDGGILLCALPVTAAGEESAPIRVSWAREASDVHMTGATLKNSDF